jgi:hypothetical protein
MGVFRVWHFLHLRFSSTRPPLGPGRRPHFFFGESSRRMLSGSRVGLAQGRTGQLGQRSSQRTSPLLAHPLKAFSTHRPSLHSKLSPCSPSARPSPGAFAPMRWQRCGPAQRQLRAPRGQKSMPLSARPCLHRSQGSRGAHSCRRCPIAPTAGCVAARMHARHGRCAGMHASVPAAQRGRHAMGLDCHAASRLAPASEQPPHGADACAWRRRWALHGARHACNPATRRRRYL